MMSVDLTDWSSTNQFVWHRTSSAFNR